MNMENILIKINESKTIDLDESFMYCKQCSALLRCPENTRDARKIIIHILENWTKIDPNTHEMWTDIIESQGFYPYLEKNKEKFVFKYTAGELRKEMSKSKNLPYYLHDEQLEVKNLLDSDINVIVSAPTSFGKSLLIEELVAEKKYNNIVIIQPTLALLDETRKKLKTYDNWYSIIVRTSQEASDIKANLFLLTAERVMEYQNLPKIDLLIIDEFYKLSAKRDDERSDVLNNAFHLLLNRDNVKFYLLGPNIDGISEGFAEKYNAVFFRTDYSLVEQDIIDKYSSSFGTRGQKKTNKENALFDLLFSLKNEQTMIYCSSPARARYLSNSFLKFLITKIEATTEHVNLIEWIEKNVNPKWSLINCLKYGIAFHDGALQKHISSSVIKYFNETKINFLFCTSTIIEGVNTSAKNIIIFDKHKGQNINKNIIDYFDYSNIKGRAGRMMIHYIGTVYNFNLPIEKMETMTVDIPFFQQEPIKDEVLIHLDDSEITNKDSDQYEKIERIPVKERELIKKNGVLVDGQLLIHKKLRQELHPTNNLILWNQYPKYEELKYILDMAWDNLLKEGETQRPMTKGNLTRVTYGYGLNSDIMWLVSDTLNTLKKDKEWIIENKEEIENIRNKMTKDEKTNFKKTSDYKKYEWTKRLFNLSNNDLLDEAIRTSFNILRHWFQYKVPKWLRTINSLQQFICEEKGIKKSGNYSFYADKIESDFIRDNLSILLEYGIPKSAINKIEKYIHKDMNENEVVNRVKSKNFLDRIDFLKYEKEKIIDSL